MKVLIKLCILSVLMFSCEDFLDTKIDTRRNDDNLYSNYAVIYEFAYAPYTYLNDISDGFTVIDNNLFAVPSDEAVQAGTSYDQSDLYTKGLMNPFNAPDNVYNSCYRGIRAANYFLEYYEEDYREILAESRDTLSDNAVQYNLDVQDVEWLLAEVRVLRTYYYYELIKRYGDVPLVTNTLTINDNTDIGRTPVAEIVDFIISEIDSQTDKLQVNWRSFDQNRAGRLTRDAALAIKMRVLMLYASPLYNTANDLARWEQAAEVGAQILDSAVYSLDTDYRNMFISNNTVNSPEVIWAIRLGALNGLERSNYPISTPGGNNNITPSHNLVSAYEYTAAADPADPYTNRDPRLQATVVTNNSTWTGRTIETWEGGTDDYTQSNASKTGYFLKKFLNDNANLVQDQTFQRSWILFRLGEIMLNYAEAMNEAFGPDNNNGYSMSARDAVNAVRARTGVNMPVVTAADPVAMRAQIKHERRIELAFEGHRYWDLIRWKDAEVVLNQPMTGVIATREATLSYTYEVVEVEDRVFDASKSYFYPIPQTEIGKSSGVLTQNVGW